MLGDFSGCLLGSQLSGPHLPISQPPSYFGSRPIFHKGLIDIAVLIVTLTNFVERPQFRKTFARQDSRFSLELGSGTSSI